MEEKKRKTVKTKKKVSHIVKKQINEPIHVEIVPNPVIVDDWIQHWNPVWKTWCFVHTKQNIYMYPRNNQFIFYDSFGYRKHVKNDVIESSRAELGRSIKEKLDVKDNNQLLPSIQEIHSKLQISEDYPMFFTIQDKEYFHPENKKRLFIEMYDLQLDTEKGKLLPKFRFLHWEDITQPTRAVHKLLQFVYGEEYKYNKNYRGYNILSTKINDESFLLTHFLPPDTRIKNKKRE